MKKRLGRYELVEPLGQGGMGEVWLARLSGPGGFEKPAIVKTVLPALARDEQFVQRFHHEGKVLVHLSHSNIAQIYDLDQDEGVLFMALEYVAGIDVARLVSQVAQADELIPVPIAVFIAWQAAEGLGYAHNKVGLDGVAMSIVHRDVSPQNVMISFEGEVKVIDFGIARSTARSHSTQAQMVIGKLGYMAPEQALGEQVDARADQYSLAVMLWELLAGRHYVAAGTTPETMVAMAHPKRQPLAPLRSEVDLELDAVVQKALSKTASDRYPSTDDFARALLAQLTRLGQPTRKQVGDWVKLKCREAYQSNQRLLSKLSSLSPQATAQTLPSVRASELLSEGALKAVRPTRTPLIAAAVLAVVLLGGGLWFFRTTDNSESTRSTVKAEPPTVPAQPQTPVMAVAPVAVAPVAMSDAGPANLDLVPTAAVKRTSPTTGVRGPLNASMILVQEPSRAVRLKNNGSFSFTRCSILIPGQRQADFANLPAGMSREIVLANFADAPSAPVLENQVRLTCAQGSITLPAQ